MSEFAPHSSRAAAGDTQAVPDASTWGVLAGSGAAPAAPAPVPPSVILGAVAARAGVSPIVARAAEAWLDNEEVYELLHNFGAHGFVVSSKPAQNPPSGTLFIYDRSTTRNFRQDGVRYIMRTDRPQSAKESNMKLKVNDVKVMNVSYASCPPQGSNGSQDGDEDVVFRRRVYSLWPKRAGGGPDFVLVHYLREKAGSKARRSSLTRSHQPPLQFAGAVRTTPKLEPSAAPVQPDAPLSIVEFSPNWDTSRGGAKILVCLSGDHATLQRLRSKELPAQCQFGALTVPAECVAPGVLRCIAPMHTAGTVPFSVALDGNPVSEYKRFEYRPPAVAHMPKPSAFGRYGPHDTHSGASGAEGAAGSQGRSLSGTNGFHTQSFGSLPGFGGQSDLLELLSGSGPRDSMTDLMLDDGALSVSPSGLSIDADLAADIDMNVNGSPGAFLSPFAADTPTLAAEQPGFPPSASAALVQAVAGTAAGVVAHASAAGVAASQGLTTFAARPGMSIPSPTTWGTDTTFAGAGAGAGAGGGGQSQPSSGARPQFAAPFVGGGAAGAPPQEQHADRDSVMRRPKIRRRDAAAVRAARVRAREEPHRDRETKIRIVERLGRVENSLSNHQRQGGAHDGAASAGVAADGFLDDAALEGMSDEKLQALTEQLLEHVISELTKHASEEEALMQELITSDVNGMTMLHYTCMYNYPRLVPVLLANGADPNKPTAAGQSPLHLAASHGQWDIVAQLIHAGASALSRDKSGLTPHMRAYRNGHKALGAKLQSIAIRQAHLAGLTVESGAGTTAGFGTPARTPHISPTNAADGAVPPVPPSSVTSSGSTPPAPPSSSRNAPRTGLTLLGDAIGGPAPNPRTLSRSSSAGDGGKSEEEEEEEEETRKLLLNAFSNMTLHDKCAISLVMGRDKDGAGGLEAGLGLPDGLFGGVGGLRDTDVASVLSDNDASLVQAMSLMSDEEQLSLEADARRIQTNVRSWLLRRNYRSMRDAARKLQAATRGMLARKNFEVHKHKAFAALVIQRATRTWLKSFGDVTATRSARKTSSHGSLHPVPEE